MISFKQFLNEEEQSVDEVVALLNRECAPYLSYMKSHPPHSWLKRGWYTPPAGAYFQMSTRKNRKPVDMSQKMHNLLDYTLLKQHGARFRSESVFCSVSEGIASSYGDNVYIVLPRGEFKYCWSPEIEDAYAFFDYHKHDVAPMGLKKMEAALGKEFAPSATDINVASPEWLSFVSDYLMTVKPYISTDLYEAMSKLKYGRNEVMLSCDSAFYILHTSDPSSEIEAEHAQFAAEVLDALA